MPKGHARSRAKLLWEVTCERLRNALDPPVGAPEGPTDALAEAYVLALEALETLRQAFDIETGDPADPETGRARSDPAHGKDTVRKDPP